jgi:hypothetical protein
VVFLDPRAQSRADGNERDGRESSAVQSDAD